MIFSSRFLNVLLVACAFAAVAVVAAPAFDEPAYQLEPTPMDPAKLPPPTVEQEQAARLPTERCPRPRLTFCFELGCKPCQRLEQEIEAGVFGAFSVEILRREKDQPPGWVKWYPAVLFTDDATPPVLYALPRQDVDEPPPVPTAAQIFEAWQRHNPRAVLTTPIGPAKSWLDQLTKFAGPDGTITIQPAKPIAAILEDGTKVSYSRLSGKYQIRGGIPSIVFDAPFARVDARKFGLHIGAEIRDARFEPPATASVGTTAGRYRFKMEKAE